MTGALHEPLVEPSAGESHLIKPALVSRPDVPVVSLVHVPYEGCTSCLRCSSVHAVCEWRCGVSRLTYGCVDGRERRERTVSSSSHGVSVHARPEHARPV